MPPVTADAGALRRGLHAQLAERVGHGLLPGHDRGGAAPAREARRSSSGIYEATFKQLTFAMLTIASMLGLAYLMNYSGMTSTLGLALADDRRRRSRSSAPCVGWLGVFLTGSDTSANALFGNLQVVTANALGLNPILTASVNSAAGVMGKMISVQSIAVAVAATGMTLGRREPAVPLHHQAQRAADGRDGPAVDAVRLRVPGLGADPAAEIIGTAH